MRYAAGAVSSLCLAALWQVPGSTPDVLWPLEEPARC